MRSLYHIALALWRIPETRHMLGYFLYLSGISGGFWILSKFVGIFAWSFHTILIDELGQLFAVLYNAVLAILFASIIALSIVLAGQHSPAYFWYQASGFVFVYVVLSAAYTDRRTHELEQHAAFGFLAGLASYLGFAIFPVYLTNPAIIQTYMVVSWLGHSWMGKCASAYAIGRGLWYFFKLAMSPITTHPAIRLRRDAVADEQ